MLSRFSPHTQERSQQQAPRYPLWRCLPALGITGLLLQGLVACDLSNLTGKQELPAGVQDPSAYHSPEGARQLYQGTLTTFQVRATLNGESQSGAMLSAMFYGGLLTDELQDGSVLGSPSSDAQGILTLVDARRDGAVGAAPNSSSVYSQLQTVRGNAAVTLGVLASYDTVDSPALRGHMYAVLGYAELLLADVFCSGVPLSTIDVGRDYTYRPSSTTTQVYQAAIAHFDTALTLSQDSARIENLAWVGKARAYLDLGQYDSAAVAAAHVPDDFTYQFPVHWASTNAPNNTGRLFSLNNGSPSDREGINGLPFRSSGDPRSAVVLGDSTIRHQKNNYGAPVYFPVKYGGDISTANTYPFTVADGIEARLIQAEAAYHGVATGTGTWLQQLNALRHANASTSSLPDLTDPGTADARVDLIFQERAYWLYLTGHRMGDLRREIRNYQRSSENIFPTGAYSAPNVIHTFGTQVSAPIPSSELLNPYFHGCLSTGA